jgi:class 3 adenylate cyclase
MRCPNCHSENPEKASFCIECGAAFERRCLKCEFDNLPEAKFCSHCGSSLIELATAQTSSISTTDVSNGDTPQRRIEHDGERRHLTVLFCDLVGSTAIAARLDPEEWRETLAGFHRVAAAGITRFDGHVAKYLGDGVMAYFGWPAAHDNDAECAARAGLAILDAIAKLNQQPGHAQLSARVGVDSGLVVIGKGAGNEAEVFGEVPNIAARVQATAEPGTAAITDATHRLVAGLFVVEDRGAQELKGLERPLQLYRVVRPSGARGRFEVTTAIGRLTPFVGREDELHSLMNRWQRALEGDGQVALIIGEAGIGKSRLVQRFHEQISGTPHTWIEAGADTFFQNTPFYPVIEMLRLSLIAGDHGPSDAIAQLAGVLTHADLDSAAAIPLIAPLLNLTLPPEYPPSTLSPEQQRRRLLATLVEWVIGSARKQPLIIATEDLHWADPSTLELIQLLVEQGATARLLLLYTARPEFHAPWPMRAHHAQINLNRLSASNVRMIVAQIAAKIALPDETIATVVERTGGVPLFVEELTRAVLESDDAKLAGREIPATLRDSLMARLDRLGPAKEIIQIGAVIGSEFSYELLHAVHPVAEEILQRALQSLADAELVYVRGIAPEASYQFKHALIRDVAYEALLKTSRREWHKRIGRVMEQQFSHVVDQNPEVIAHHLTEAGIFLEGARYWRKAGQRAIERSAHLEAITQSRRGLLTLNVLGVTDETMSEEVKLQPP